MKKFVYLIIGIPAAVLLIILSVANRQDVMFRLDPFNSVDPAVSVTLPFFVFLFIAFLAGMIIGGSVSWFSQGRARRTARREKERARRLEEEVRAEKKRADGMSGENLPAIGSGKAA